MNNKFEMPSNTPKEESAEEIIITDSNSYKEAIKTGEFRAADEWIQLKRAIFDEWKLKQESLLDGMAPEEKQAFEETLKGKVRGIDHRENELSKAYREKEMWAKAKEIISKSINPNSFEPRKNRLEDQSEMSYEEIPEAEGFR